MSLISILNYSLVLKTNIFLDLLCAFQKTKRGVSEHVTTKNQSKTTKHNPNKTCCI